jgi:hypothetical protein
MPRRTNLFQRAVRVLHENIAGEAVVEESKMLLDTDVGEPSEVDVVITTAVAGQEIIIGVEATAAGRKATRPWVDSMLGKHSSLPTDRLVLVSEAGFSKAARTKAEVNRAIPLAPEDLRGDEAVGIVVNKLGAVFIKAFNLHMDEVAIRASVPGSSDSLEFEGAPVGTPLFAPNGDLLGTVAETIKGDIDRRFVQIAEEMDLANVTEAETRNITLSVQGPIEAFQNSDSDRVPAGPACVRLDEVDGERAFFGPVQSITVKARLEFEVGEIPLTHAKMTGLSPGFSFGEGNLGDRSATFVVDESGGRPRGRMILETDDGCLESAINPVNEPSEDSGAAE